ncbi:hypothetical protein BGX23_007387 [Mortierella sp. AD031]|nr:hypothetical protein BGX23_007387 [Mortierella sp. AD031]
MGEVNLVEEFTLRIRCDPLGLTPPFNTKSLVIKHTYDSYHSPQWQVAMTRVNDSLDIQLRSLSYSRLPTNFRSVNIIYHQQHLTSVPLSESAFSNWGELKLSFPVDKALHRDKYEFDIILSTQPQLTESLRLDPSSSSKFAKSKMLGRKDLPSSPLRLDPSQAMMKMFLRDRRSVDVQFLFTSEWDISSTGRLTGLWAHSLVLSRYPAFDALVQEAIQARHCEANCTAEPLTIPMTKFSLPALSCLLYYLYTGKVQLATRPDLFALSQTDQHSAMHTHECAQIETDTVMVGRQYHTDILPSVELSCQHVVEWGSGVSCKELYAIAKHFGVIELQKLCLEGMVDSIDATNVVEMLFEFGGSSASVRESGLAFVNDNLGALFADGRDPFASYRDREECYVIMVEVMRSFTRHLQVASHSNKITLATAGSGH